MDYVLIVMNSGYFQGVFRVFFPRAFLGMPFGPFQPLPNVCCVKSLPCGAHSLHYPVHTRTISAERRRTAMHRVFGEGDFFRADFWGRGCDEAHFSEKRVLSVKRREAIQ